MVIISTGISLCSFDVDRKFLLFFYLFINIIMIGLIRVNFYLPEPCFFKSSLFSLRYCLVR
ncbi:MAG: hypothetical protein DSY70_06565 [Desulfobulbus sp.]|nr:MAG: hypothetical protein DSY70_06565 [Desulfobulbus sp.]